MSDNPATNASDTEKPQATPPYTYFRADGLAQEQVETVRAAQKEFDKLKKDIVKRFGANEAMCWVDRDTQRLRIESFHYSPAQEKNVPAHWETRRQTGSNGELQAIFAHPPAGSPDQFFLVDYAGLMQRAHRRMRLENTLGCGDMPMKELPAGSYETAFVRDSHIKSAGRAGHIQQNFVGLYGSGSPCRSSDPVDAMQMMGSWYIRVPNDEKGQPRFTPPDSAAVPMAEMIKLDNEERAARFNRLQSSSFDPHI
ncbi:MAG: hypothetical protein ACK4PK_00730 [Alphaproteobacteria bacterium]